MSRRSDHLAPNDPHTPADVLHLRQGGTSLLVRTTADDLPSILHWGPDLGDIPADLANSSLELLHTSGPDEPIWPHPWCSLLPSQTSGWLGRPGLRGSHDGRHGGLTYTRAHHDVDPRADATALRSEAVDELAQIAVSTELEVQATGLVRLRASVRNLAELPYTVASLEPALPVPHDAEELLDLAGGPTHERVPQRRRFDQGVWMREAWGGRPGHEFPTLLAAGQLGFGFRSGHVWGAHLAWSGNQNLYAEHSYTGWRLLRGGEVLSADEVVLQRGETYTSPWLIGSWGAGLDELSARFHQHLRAQDNMPSSPRPVVLNTWEAIGFNIDVPTLTALAEAAADTGVERFVVDDGWFRGRRDDTGGLGDWTVDATVLPDGLGPVVKTVQSLGMDFGLWIEPEMINLNSDLARAHPDWILGTHAGPGLASRSQHVLDLTNPDAWQHVFSHISDLIAELGIAALKWDHNRPLTGQGRGPDHLPAVHTQTLAVYRLMAALRERHPGLDIESCCGGGGRADLGILQHANRVWPSDTIDAHERHRIVRWTGLTLPLDMLGTHIGASLDHSTHRRLDLDFRAATAVWGNLGIECDVTRMSPTERDTLRRWVAFHKDHRSLLHSGVAVHADGLNPALQLDGVIATDQSEGLFRLSCLAHSAQFPPGRITLPGLLPSAHYELRAVGPSEPGKWSIRAPWSGSSVSTTGSLLGEVGLQTPPMDPDTIIYLHLQLTR